MLSDNDEQVLGDAVRAARAERRTREPFWKSWIKAYHGRHWRNGTGSRSQMNYAYIFMSTFLPAVAFKTPKIKLKPKIRGANEIAAEVYQNGLNSTAHSIGMIQELRSCIIDAFYSTIGGIMKVGLVGADYMLPSDNSSDPGAASLDLAPFSPLLPYAKRVSPFNFLWDETSTTFRSCQFLGDEFDRNIEMIIDDPRYDLQGYEPEDLAYRNDGYEVHQHKQTVRDKMPKVAHIVELFLRDTRRLVSLIETGKDSFIIARSVPYWGPDNGPYRQLAFTTVPDSACPMSPGAGQWDQLCDLEEQQYELAKEIKSEKRIVAFKGGARKSAEILKMAKHDHIVTDVDDVGTQIVFGGASKERIEGVNILQANYYMSSALSDVMRGTPTGVTATESSLANNNANIRLDDSRLQIRDFAADIFSDMFWYSFYDENVLLQSGIQVPGTGDTLNLLVKGGVDIDPDTGQPTTSFNATDFTFEVDADSMYRLDGPVERAQALEEAQFMIEGVFPLGMTMGFMPDFLEFVRQLGERIGRPGLERMFVPMTPEQQMAYLQMQMMGQAVDAGSQGAATSGGSKPPVQNAPGGGQGQIMRNVMSRSPMMMGATKGASRVGQANKPVKGKNQNSFTAPKTGE